MTALHFSDNDGAPIAQPLQLKLLHSHGRSADGVLPLVAAGTGLAQALVLGGERLNTAQWEDAERCRVAWHGAAHGWRLSHNSRAVVCVVNGRRVATQAALPLAVGDVLEIGWQRFEVQAADPAPRAALGPAPLVPEPVVPFAAPSDAAPAEAPAFDLRDLDLSSLAASPMNDPFGVLGIAGAETRPVADPLAELLGEMSPRTAQPRVPDQSTPAANAGLLESLHAEFDRVVRDPSQLTGRADWEDAADPGFGQAPSLEELSRQAAPYPLLRDILEPREHVDQLISGFHPLARPTLLDPDPTEDVLRLFAPPQLCTVPTAVPSLTRREHHELSLDSHMYFDVFQPDAEKGRFP